jgi:hypothetical protein
MRTRCMSVCVARGVSGRRMAAPCLAGALFGRERGAARQRRIPLPSTGPNTLHSHPVLFRARSAPSPLEAHQQHQQHITSPLVISRTTGRARTVCDDTNKNTHRVLENQRRVRPSRHASRAFCSGARARAAAEHTLARAGRISRFSARARRRRVWSVVGTVVAVARASSSSSSSSSSSHPLRSSDRAGVVTPQSLRTARAVLDVSTSARDVPSSRESARARTHQTSSLSSSPPPPLFSRDAPLKPPPQNTHTHRIITRHDRRLEARRAAVGRQRKAAPWQPTARR